MNFLPTLNELKILTPRLFLYSAIVYSSIRAARFGLNQVASRLGMSSESNR